MPTEHSGYLAKYLSKSVPNVSNGWRLCARFGKGWGVDKVKDVIPEALFSRTYRACKEWKQWQGRERFFERIAVARRMMILAIENDWNIGLGPSGKPYSRCSEAELTFGKSEVGLERNIFHSAI